MLLQEQLMADMKEAMKAGETARLGTLRLALNGLANERIKQGHQLEDDEAIRVLQREVKQRRDSIAQYQQAGRPELAATEQSELDVLKQYLPAQLSETDLESVIDEVLAGVGEAPQVGAVIGAVKAKVGAQADGSTIARLVQARLAAK